MTDIMLRGALNALKTKIEALAASETATAEDLAMLGTALERIAGKTTAIEVAMVGEEQRAAFAVEAAMSRDSALQAIAEAQAPVILAIEASRDAALAAVAATTEGAVAEVNETAIVATEHVVMAPGLTATSFFFNQL
jgi:hypothetical protein